MQQRGMVGGGQTTVKFKARSVPTLLSRVSGFLQELPLHNRSDALSLLVRQFSEYSVIFTFLKERVLY